MISCEAFLRPTAWNRLDSVRESRGIPDSKSNDRYRGIGVGIKGDRIHARRRVVNLACSCGGEARRRDIKVIRAASQKPLDHAFKMIATASALVTKEGVS